MPGNLLATADAGPTRMLVLLCQDTADWPLLPPLPSYGRGRELPGPRYASLIHGQNLTDVVITGENGTIDGRGRAWWKRAEAGTLQFTRGHLVELLWTDGLAVSNITLLNSPFWALHPAYCNDVEIADLTIHAPADSPNTDGIDVDSCSNVLIEGCCISTGDDAVAIKSGWDEYGQRYGAPCVNVTVRNLWVSAPAAAGFAIGSEMSGGVANVSVVNVTMSRVRYGVRVKTGPGRGGYVTDVDIVDVAMEDADVAISVVGDAARDHPDDDYDPDALPDVAGLSITHLTGVRVRRAGELLGLARAPLRRIDLAHVHLDLVAEGGTGFTCAHVSGSACKVVPDICPELDPDSSDDDDINNDGEGGTCQGHVARTTQRRWWLQRWQ
eukprot:SM000004S14983  [mRNA]  locus=s4:617698:619152:+ [translate_table: standard]